MLTPKRPEATCLIFERRSSVKRTGILAALAGVRAAADPVHRDGERLVRLARERAERHRAGREALDDLCRGLDVLERDRPAAGYAEAEQPAQCRAARGVGVDRRRELLVRLAAAAAHRVLQQRDRLGVPLVVLAVAPPRVEADDRQQLASRAGIRARVADERAFRELGAARCRRSATACP